MGRENKVVTRYLVSLPILEISKLGKGYLGVRFPKDVSEKEGFESGQHVRVTLELLDKKEEAKS